VSTDDDKMRNSPEPTAKGGEGVEGGVGPKKKYENLQ